VILTDADQLREALRVALEQRDEVLSGVATDEAVRFWMEAAWQNANQRDEARATYREMQDLMEAHKADAARLTEERDRVARELRLLDEHGNLRAAIRAAAERQREACAANMHPLLRSMLARQQAAELCRATPLVTEVES
jgi:hypothetical protein